MERKKGKYVYQFKVKPVCSWSLYMCWMLLNGSLCLQIFPNQNYNGYNVTENMPPLNTSEYNYAALEHFWQQKTWKVLIRSIFDKILSWSASVVRAIRFLCSAAHRVLSTPQCRDGGCVYYWWCAPTDIASMQHQHWHPLSPPTTKREIGHSCAIDTQSSIMDEWKWFGGDPM